MGVKSTVLRGYNPHKADDMELKYRGEQKRGMDHGERSDGSAESNR